MNTENILKAKFPEELVSSLLSYFFSIEKSYRLENWKPSELDAGHFVEIVRRIIENELFGVYTPLDKSIGSFNPQVLTKYEQASGDESFRIIIPRCLYSIYCIRNKRGVGHVGVISPNKMDASVILNSCKWVMAELVRLAGQNCPNEAADAINSLMEKHVDVIWQEDDIFMILDKKLAARDKVLISLYKQDKSTINDLQLKVEYSNTSNFKKIIKALHKDKLIHFNEKLGICSLSPLGVSRASEKIS